MSLRSIVFGVTVLVAAAAARAAVVQIGANPDKTDSGKKDKKKEK